MGSAFVKGAHFSNVVEINLNLIEKNTLFSYFYALKCIMINSLEVINEHTGEVHDEKISYCSNWRKCINKR